MVGINNVDIVWVLLRRLQFRRWRHLWNRINYFCYYILPTRPTHKTTPRSHIHIREFDRGENNWGFGLWGGLQRLIYINQYYKIE